MDTTKPLIGPTGIWSEELASHAHRHDGGLERALLEMFDDGTRVLADYGCGTGRYINYLRPKLRHAYGYEGTGGNGFNVFEEDLSLPSFISKPCDFALCLEVGEHIPPQFQDTFLDNITHNVRETIVLSWALPGQGGDGHVNELPADVVIAEMKKRGFRKDEVKTRKLRLAATLPWFKKTINVYNRVR